MTIKINIKTHGMDRLFAQMNTLLAESKNSYTVRVGVIDKKQSGRSYPKRPFISPSQVAIWQNYGAAGQPTVPARPFMDKAVAYIKRSYVIKRAFKMSNVKEFGFNAHMANSIGMQSAEIIKRTLANESLYEPLKKRTIRKKMNSKGHARILREHYLLQQSIHYEVRNRKGELLDTLRMARPKTSVLALRVFEKQYTRDGVVQDLNFDDVKGIPTLGGKE